MSEQPSFLLARQRRHHRSSTRVLPLPPTAAANTIQLLLQLPSTSNATSLLMDTVLAAKKIQEGLQNLDTKLYPTSAANFKPESPPGVLKGGKCVGCGSESAIRVHYGASSCHGCKAFFRRSVFEGRIYVCSADNNCDITNESRNRCRACRLNNCMKGGMNPKHVREERSKIERMPPSTNNIQVCAVSRPTPKLMEDIKPISTIPPPTTIHYPELSISTSYTTTATMTSPMVQSTSNSVEYAASEAEAVGPTIEPRSVFYNSEQEITQKLVALEKFVETLKDEDAMDNDGMGHWSRDISLSFGLHHPQMVIRRFTINYKCEKIMEASDLYMSWYRTFVLQADWAMRIEEFKALPQPDQTALFKQNFMAFAWINLAYNSYTQRKQEVGIPLGNGAYIPYADSEQQKLPPRWAATYGVVCKKLIDLIVKVMIELEMSEEEYCLIKTTSLFQYDCILSEPGMKLAQKYREQLLDALSHHIQLRFPTYNTTQVTSRALKISLLLPSLSYIGQVESTLIQQLTAADLHQLSGVPMEICAAQQTTYR